MEQDPTFPLNRAPVAEPVPTHEILRALASDSEASIRFGKIVAAAGSRVHGLALFLLVLPETVPLPLPSASVVLGIPLLLISGHLWLFGEHKRLPARILKLKIPRAVLVAIARHISPVLERLEALSRPRFGWLVHKERVIGLMCFWLSLILFLPLPLVNAPPAICIAAIALGMIQRDGLIIAAGMAGTVILTAALAWLAVLATSVI